MQAPEQHQKSQKSSLVRNHFGSGIPRRGPLAIQFQGPVTSTTDTQGRHRTGRTCMHASIKGQERRKKSKMHRRMQNRSRKIEPKRPSHTRETRRCALTITCRINGFTFQRDPAIIHTSTNDRGRTGNSGVHLKDNRVDCQHKEG